MIPAHARPPRGEFLGAAWEVARGLRDHGTYGSAAKAAKALRRRCPGFSDRQYANAIRKGLALHEAAVELVAADAASLRRQTDVEAGRFPDFRGLADAARRRCAGFRPSTYRAAIVWIFYWHHLK